MDCPPRTPSAARIVRQVIGSVRTSSVTARQHHFHSRLHQRTSRLSNDIPAGSDFAVRFSVYNHLRSLPFGVTVVLTT